VIEGRGEDEVVAEVKVGGDAHQEVGTASRADREAVRGLLVSSYSGSSEDRSVLVEKLRACGSIEYAQKRAQEFADMALAAIAGLDQSEGKSALIELSRFVTKRTA